MFRIFQKLVVEFVLFLSMRLGWLLQENFLKGSIKVANDDLSLRLVFLEVAIVVVV